MTTKYHNPAVDSMLGDSDVEREEVKGIEKEATMDTSLNQSKRSPESVTNGNSKKERRRRKHRNEGSKYAKPKQKSEGRRVSGMSTKENLSDGLRYRHRRSMSHRSSSISSSDEDEPIQDHRAILAAARARLTSPSMLSTFTTQTNATNTSSSSSGSNSTVTQMSIAKRVTVSKKQTAAEEAPLSPAVPDPPNVFTFLEGLEQENIEAGESDEDEVGSGQDKQKNQQGVVEECPDSDEEEEETDEEEESGDETPQWAQRRIEAPPAADLSHVPVDSPRSASSSASSSFHGDDFSDPPADNDTDRSTSPERSVNGHDNHEPRPLETIPEISESPIPPLTPNSADRASASMASQMEAAQQRQNLHRSLKQFGTPDMPRGNANLPVASPSILSARYPQPVAQRPLPRGEKLPVTGYELLASQLSTRADGEEGSIKPLYRKFEALNHRLLLHLQDELSELEEQLHRLDHADTQSRRTTDRHIVPASRRAAAIAGGELQWHKTDILGRIGFKLAQYNQALTSFNETQLLAPPSIDDIEQYREYLEVEQPIHESETHFLDPEDDLVSLSSQSMHHRSRYRRPERSESPSSEESVSEVSSLPSAAPPENVAKSPMVVVKVKTKENRQSMLSAIAAAIATSVLLPVLTFTVIPNFIGRLTMTFLVAAFTVVALLQAQILNRKVLLGRDALSCAGIYGGVMIVLAGIMS